MDTNRLETFSDGVFAIAITLLVLGIEVPSPDAALGRELVRLWPSYLAYAASFLLIGAIWINHHVMFRHIVRSDGTLLVLNLLHLMVVAFLPFSTAVLTQAFIRSADEPIAAAFYGATLAVGGIVVNAMWRYAAHDRRLLAADLGEAKVRRISRRFLVGPVLYIGLIAFHLILPSRAPSRAVDPRISSEDI